MAEACPSEPKHGARGLANDCRMLRPAGRGIPRSFRDPIAFQCCSSFGKRPGQQGIASEQEIASGTSLMLEIAGSRSGVGLSIRGSKT